MPSGPAGRNLPISGGRHLQFQTWTRFCCCGGWIQKARKVPLEQILQMPLFQWDMSGTMNRITLWRSHRVPPYSRTPSKAPAFKRFLNCDECSALERNVRYFLGFIRNFEGGIKSIRILYTRALCREMPRRMPPRLRQ